MSTNRNKKQQNVIADSFSFRSRLTCSTAFPERGMDHSASRLKLHENSQDKLSNLLPAHSPRFPPPSRLTCARRRPTWRTFYTCTVDTKNKLIHFLCVFSRISNSDVFLFRFVQAEKGVESLTTSRASSCGKTRNSFIAALILRGPLMWKLFEAFPFQHFLPFRIPPPHTLGSTWKT